VRYTSGGDFDVGMSDPMVSIEGLGKRYRLRHVDQEPYVALRDVMTSAMSAPLRWLKPGPASKTLAEDFWALKDVFCEIARGEVVGIIGRNGAGKSTLLKILSRITEPSTGRVTLHGRVASLLEVGTGFHPELTGRENIFLNAAILGMSRAEIARKFDEIVAFADVERFLDTPVKRYSSGMYVRLAFAVAAHLEPEILVVDEVLAVGDAEFQKKCIGKMQNVSRGGRTVLFVSHNLASVEALCSRAVLLSSGHVAMDGPVREVIAAYHAMTNARDDRAEPFNPMFRRATSPVFVSATLVDHEGRPTSQMMVGDRFVLEMVVRPEQPLHNPSIGIAVDDMLGRRILDLHNPLSRDEFGTIDAAGGVVRCRVDVFPLAPGEYTVKLALSERVREVDVIEHALTFEVVNADTFKDGRGYLSGLCVAPAAWSFVPENRSVAASPRS
jgi:lipopolysaccharide transport system ATP-binding protein